MRSLAVPLLAIALVFGAPAVWAHGIFVFAYVEDGALVVEGYTASGEPVRDGEIRITTPDGRDLAAGRTDDGGVFRCAVPAADAVSVELKAGPGHVARATAELGEAGATTAELKHSHRAGFRQVLTGLLAIGGLFAGAMVLAGRKRRKDTH